MFDFFKTLKEENSRLNKAKETPKYVPEGMLKESKPEPERRYYSLGPTTEGRVMLAVNYGNISMDEKGIDCMIKALEASKVWLEDKSGKQPESACHSEEQPV